MAVFGGQQVSFCPTCPTSCPSEKVAKSLIVLVSHLYHLKIRKDFFRPAHGWGVGKGSD
jgi:hypothetical protein